MEISDSTMSSIPSTFLVLAWACLSLADVTSVSFSSFPNIFRVSLELSMAHFTFSCNSMMWMKGRMAGFGGLKMIDDFTSFSSSTFFFLLDAADEVLMTCTSSLSLLLLSWKVRDVCFFWILLGFWGFNSARCLGLT